MWRSGLAAVVLLLGPVGMRPAHAADADDAWRLDAAVWEDPRGAREVLADPALRAAVQAWISRDAQARAGGTASPRLCLHHVDEAVARRRAEALRDWLVALALPSAAIDLHADGDDPARLILTLDAAP